MSNLKLSTGYGKTLSLSPQFLKLIINTVGMPHLGTKIRLRLLLKALRHYPKLSTSKILDAGCGYGYISFELAKRGYKTIGLDSNPKKLSVGKSLFGSYSSNLNLLKGSIYHLPFKNNEFDICLCLEVLEHLKDASQALKELARVIKKRGFLIISFPEKEADRKIFKLLDHLRPGYSIEEIIKIVKPIGFRLTLLLPYPKTVLGKIILILDIKLHKKSLFLSSLASLFLYTFFLLDLVLPQKSQPLNYLIVLEKVKKQ